MLGKDWDVRTSVRGIIHRNGTVLPLLLDNGTGREVAFQYLTNSGVFNEGQLNAETHSNRQHQHANEKLEKP